MAAATGSGTAAASGASLGPPQRLPLVAKRARDAGALGVASWHKLTNHTSEIIVKRPPIPAASPRRVDGVLRAPMLYGFQELRVNRLAIAVTNVF